jgi:hypothetical protein
MERLAGPAEKEARARMSLLRPLASFFSPLFFSFFFPPNKKNHRLVWYRLGDPVCCFFFSAVQGSLATSAREKMAKNGLRMSRSLRPDLRSGLRLERGSFVRAKGHWPTRHMQKIPPSAPFLGVSILDSQLALEGEARATGSRLREERGRKGEERRGNERNETKRRRRRLND